MKARHYQYEPSQSPWNRRALIWLWCLQLIPSIIVSGLAAALQLPKQEDERSDDGISYGVFIITSYIVFSYTVMTVGFTVFQVIYYKKNALHPMWAMIIAVWMVACWLSVIGMAGWGIGFSAPTFKVFEASLLLDALAGLPYIAGLVYFSIIFDRWKKAQKPTKIHADPEAELHSLDSRKPFARTHENDISPGH